MNDNEGVRLPRLGLGTGPIAGLYDEVTAAAARATIDEAWSAGIRYFDTAPLYGSGLAEERLGDALASRRRGEFVVSTKVGRVLRPGQTRTRFVGARPFEPVFDYSAAGVRRSLGESLERLGLERVDIALLHDPEEHLDEAIHAVDVVRELVPVVGVGTNHVATALTLVAGGHVDVVLLAGRYTLLDRSAERELLPLCAERGVALVTAGVFNSGLLAGGSTFDYVPAPPHLIQRRNDAAAVCARYDVPLAAAAIQFPLRHPAVHTVVVGARSPSEIAEDVGLLAHPIPDELWGEIDGIGQLPAART